MTQLHAQADDVQPRLEKSAATGIRASLGAVMVSVVLGTVKIVAGVVGHSYALVADGIESMLDVASGLAVAGSLKVAAWPPDEKYPFGYGKVEPLAALTIAATLLATSVYIAIKSISEILAPHETPAPFTLVVLIIVVAVKELMFRFLFRTGQAIESRAVETDAWHHRSDSLTSLAAFIGISI
jgi:cation diffusion facilitator family transporter